VLGLIGTQLATATYSASTMSVVSDANAGRVGATMPWTRLVKVDLTGAGDVFRGGTESDPARATACNGTAYITVVCPDAATANDIGALESAMDGVMAILAHAVLSDTTNKVRVRVSNWRLVVDPNPDETNRFRTGGIELDLVVTRDKA
jgi:hypothetical protein